MLFFGRNNGMTDRRTVRKLYATLRELKITFKIVTFHFILKFATARSSDMYDIIILLMVKMQYNIVFIIFIQYGCCRTENKS